LHGVRLTVAADERVAIVGPSGAGKTTLLRVLNASLLPTSGSALFDGRSVAELGPSELQERRCRTGLVPQEAALIPVFRVLKNVLLGRVGTQNFASTLRSMLFPRASDVEAVYRILERVGIGDKLYQRAATLSGGERQRAALARALYQEPHTLLADEPIASVDPERARALMELIVDVARERSLALIVSLHDLDAARAFFPRIVGMRAGTVYFDEPTENLTDDDFEALYALQG